MANTEILLCPKCGDHLVPFVGFRAGMIYDCKTCGYHGPLNIVAKSEKDAEEIRKKLSKRKSPGKNLT
jgi:DNA-directed RNA polymerase subunit M/transcription elongation factor TFIIS